MKILKHFSKALVLIVLMICGVLFASCGEAGEKARISATTDLLEMVLSETDSKSFNVSVSGGGLNSSNIIVESYEEGDVISLSEQIISSSEVRVNVSALRPGTATIKLSTTGNSDPVEVLVNVILPIESISLKSEFENKLYVIKGQELNLYSLNFIDYNAVSVEGFENFETNQKGFRVELNGAQDGVSLSQGKLLVSDNFTADKVSITAYSAYYSERGEQASLKFDFDINVLNEIKTEIYIDKDKGINGTPIDNGEAVSLFPKESGESSVLLYLYAYVNKESDVVNVQKIIDETKFDLELYATSPFDRTINAYVYTYKLTSFSAGFSDNISFKLSYKNFTLGNTKLEYQVESDIISVTSYNKPTSVTINGSTKDKQTLTVFENIVSPAKGTTMSLNLAPGSLSPDFQNIVIFADNSQNIPVDFYVMNSTRTSYTKLTWTDDKIVVPLGTKIFLIKNNKYASNNQNFTVFAQEENYFDLTGVGGERTKVEIEINVNPGSNGVYLADEDYNLIEDKEVILIDLSDEKTQVLAISPANFDLGATSGVRILNSKLADVSDLEILDKTANYLFVKFNITPKALGESKLNVYLSDGSVTEFPIKVISELISYDIDVNEDEIETLTKYYSKGDILKFAIQNGANIQLENKVYPTSAQYKINYEFVDIISTKTLEDINLSDINLNFSEKSDVINVSMLKNYGLIQASNSAVSGKVLIRVTVSGMTESGDYSEQAIYRYVLVEVYKSVNNFVISNNNINLYSYESVGSKNTLNSVEDFTVTISANGGATPTYLENLQIYLNSLSSSPISFTPAGKYQIIDQNGEVLLDITRTLQGNEYKFTVQGMKKSDTPYLFIFKLTELSESEAITGVVRVNVVDAVEISEIEIVNVEEEIYIDNYSGENGSEFQIVYNTYTQNNEQALNNRLIFEASASLTNQGIKIDNNGKITVPAGKSAKGTITIYPESNYFVDKGVAGSPVVTLNVIVANGESKESAIRIYTAKDFEKIADEEGKDKSNLHFVLAGNITLNSQIASFSGNLYGDLNGITSTITYDGTIFGEIKAGANITNLNVIGLLAGTNGGTIENVHVLDETNLKSTSDYLGGLVNINKGTIKNCEVEAVLEGVNAGGIAGKNAGTITNTLFAGKITASGNAGAITSENSGTISSCKIEKWSENAGNFIISTGNDEPYVGAIAGKNSNKIEKTYAFAYNQTSADISTTNAKVAGLVGKNSGTISECMTNFKINGAVASNFVSEGNVPTNSYILVDENNSVYSDDTSDAQIWATKNGYNNNLPYLINAEYPEQKSHIDINLADNSDILHSDNFVVLYYYSLAESISDQKALTELQNKNTYKLTDILSSIDNLYIKSDSSILYINGDNLVVRGVGKATLSINSHYATQDCAGMTITIYVIYPISNFNVYNSTAINPANVVSNSVKVKMSDDADFCSALNSTVILNNEVYSINTNLYAVGFDAKNGDNDNDASSAISGIKTNYTSNNYYALGTFIVSPYNYFETKQDNDNENISLNVHLALQNKDFATYYGNILQSDINSINNILKDKFTKSITINTYRGVNSIQTSITEGELSPSNQLSFDILVNSDNDQENLSIAIVDEDGNDVEIFDILAQKTVSDNTKETIYVSIKQDKRINITETSNYTINVTAGDVTKNIKLTVVPQKVLNIAYDHYSEKENSSAFEINPISTSVLKPGKNGLLAINLYPYYAAYDKIEISSVNENGDFVLLEQMMAYESGYISAKSGYASERNGGVLTIYPPTNSLRKNDRGMIYVRTQILENVDGGVFFPITISVYQKDGSIKTTTFVLVSETVNKATISINGQKEGVIVRGGNLAFDVIVNENEELAAISSVKGTKEGDTLISHWDANNYTIENGKKIYPVILSAGVNADIDGDSVVQIQTTMNRSINGTLEYAFDTATIRIVDFVVENITIAGNEETDNTFVSYVGLSDTLKFNIKLSSVPAKTTTDKNSDLYKAVERIKKAQEDFLSAFKYDGNNYKINEKNGKDVRLYLYYADSNRRVFDGTTPLTNQYFELSKNDATSVKVMGLRASTTNMSLKFDYILPGMTDVLTYTYDFAIATRIYQDEDTPIQISTAEEFNRYFRNSTEAENYILTDDIYLENFTPIPNTNMIASLDGNNKVITIKNYDLDAILNSNANQTLNLALFTTVSENTTLKNLTINLYELDNIVVNENLVSTVNVAGLFINNLGIIYNCEVVSLNLKANDTADVNWENYTTPTFADGNGIRVYFGTNTLAQTKRNETTVTIAGLGIENEAEGRITNSRVGSEVYTRIINNNSNEVKEKIHVIPSHLQIVGQGEMAGFVATNRGVISASAFTNAQISNFASSGSNAVTAGFVLRNDNGAKIMASYARGYQKDSEVNSYKYTNGGISSYGISAGFVYINSAEISDCYAKINLNGGGTSRLVSGFVFQNDANSVISRCYAADTFAGETTTQMPFTGVNERGESMQNGTLENCYYLVVNYDTEFVLETRYETGAYAMSVNSLSEEDFYGFNFNLNSVYDGVWIFQKGSPELISANNIAISVRYVVENDYTDARNYPYVTEYAYGTVNNPIIIRSADEFNRAFGQTNNPNIKRSSAIENNYSTSNHSAFGNYRLVSNIDFDELSINDTIKISSSNMNLKAKKDEVSGIFDGNGFTLYNVDIAQGGDSQSLGLFSSITGGALFKNANLTVKQIGNNEKSLVGAICGHLQDSAIVNVEITPVLSSGDKPSEVIGINVVGGAVGYVSGASRLSNITSSVSVASSYSSSTKYENTTIDFSNLGYVGGIAGIVNISRNISNNAQVSKLYVFGKNLVIQGYNVGGVFGYMSASTTAKDILFEVTGTTGDFGGRLITSGDTLGGIVGINYGDISEARIEHQKAVQTTIENSLGGYYTSNGTRYGYSELFRIDSSRESINYVGAIIGEMLGGSLTNCYAKVDVVVPAAKYAGGIIGHNTSNDSFSEIYAFGDVDAEVCGGIIGLNEGNPTFTKTVAMNFYSKSNSKITEAIDSVEDEGTKVDVRDLGGFVGKMGAGKNITIAASVYANNSLTINGIKLNFNKNNLEYTIINGNEPQNISLLDLYISLDAFVSNAQNGSQINRMFLGATDPWNADMWAIDEGEYLPHLVFGITSKLLYIETPDDFKYLSKYTTPGCLVIIGDNPSTDFDPYSYSGSGGKDGKTASELKGLTGSNTSLVFDYRNFTIQTLTTIKEFKGIIRGEEAGRTYLLKNFPTLFNSIVGGTVRNITFGLDKENQTQSVEVPLLANTISNAILDNISVQNVNASLTIPQNTENFGILAKTITVNELSNIKFKNVTLTVTVNGSADKTVNIGLFAGTLEIVEGSVNSKLAGISFENCEIKNGATVTETQTSLNTGMLAGKLLLNSPTEIKNSDLTTSNLLNNTISITGNSTETKTGLLFGEVSGKNTNKITFAQLSIKNDIDKIDKCKITISGDQTTVYVGGLVGNMRSHSSLGDVKIDNIKIDYSSLTSGTIYAGLVFGESNIIDSTSESKSINGTITNKNAADAYGTALVSYIGGVAGSVAGDSKLNNFTITGSIDVKVKSEKDKPSSIGGAIGRSTEDLTLENINAGNNLTIENGTSQNNTSEQYYVNVGGAIGYASEEVTSSKTVVSATADETQKTITANAGYLNVGGAVGFIYNSTNVKTNVSANVHSNISVTSSNTINVGGVVGYAKLGEISNSRVSSEITVSGGGAKAVYNIGGVVGQTTGNVSDTYSWGNITVSDDTSIDDLYIGGVVGNGDTSKITSNYTLTSIYNKNFGSNNQNKNIRAVLGNSTNETPKINNSDAKNYYSSNVNLAIDEYNFAENKNYQKMIDRFKGEGISVGSEGTKLNPYTSFPQTNATAGYYYYLSSNAPTSPIEVPANAHIVGNNNTWSASSTPITTNYGYVAGFNFEITASLTDNSTNQYGVTETNVGIIFGCSVLVQGNKESLNDSNIYDNGQNWKSITAGIAGENEGLISDVSVMLYVKDATAGAVVDNSGIITNTIVNGVVQNGATYGFNGNDKNKGINVGNGFIFNNFSSIRSKVNIYNGNCVSNSLYYDRYGTEIIQVGFSGIGDNYLGYLNGTVSGVNNLGTKGVVSTRFEQDDKAKEDEAFKHNFGYVYLNNVPTSKVNTYKNDVYQIPNVGVLESVWTACFTTTTTYLKDNHKFQLVTDIDYSKPTSAQKTHTALIATGITFNGNGYIIKNIPSITAVTIKDNSDSAGYFAELTDSTIKDVEFNYAGKTVSASNDEGYAGGVVGYAKDTEFTGVRSSGATILGNTVGGLIGYADGGTITNSHNFNKVGNTSSITAGGIVGKGVKSLKIYPKSPYTTTTVSNYGDVTSSHYAGGIVGYAEGENNGGRWGINEALNSGTIKVKYNRVDTVFTLYAGGIIGYGKYAAYLQNCGNIGNIIITADTEDKNKAYLGGIAGWGEVLTTISDNVNQGSLAISAGKSSFIGGLFGSISGIITKCSMTGTMSVYQQETFGWIVGKTNNNTTISSCYIEPSTVTVENTKDENNKDITVNEIYSYNIYADYELGFKVEAGNYGYADANYGIGDGEYTRSFDLKFTLDLVGSSQSIAGGGNVVYFSSSKILNNFVTNYTSYKDYGLSGWVKADNNGNGFVRLTQGYYQINSNNNSSMIIPYVYQYRHVKLSSDDTPEWKYDVDNQSGKQMLTKLLLDKDNKKLVTQLDDTTFLNDSMILTVGSDAYSFQNGSSAFNLVKYQEKKSHYVEKSYNVWEEIIDQNEILAQWIVWRNYYGLLDANHNNISKNWSSGSPSQVTTLDRIKLTWNSQADNLTATDGVYNISTAEQLAYISKNISSTNNANIVLTDDIDLTGRVWTPIGNGLYYHDENLKGTARELKNGHGNTTGLVKELELSQFNLKVAIQTRTSGTITKIIIYDNNDNTLREDTSSGLSLPYTWEDSANNRNLIINESRREGQDSYWSYELQYGNVFSGAFDGQGHKITGMMAYDKENAGLFGSLKAQDDTEFIGNVLSTWNVIQNFTLRNASLLTEDNGKAGAIAGTVLDNPDNDNAFIIRAITLDNVMGIETGEFVGDISAVQYEGADTPDNSDDKYKIIITENTVNGSSTGIQSETDGTELIRLSKPTGYEIGAYGKSGISLTTTELIGQGVKKYYVRSTYYLRFDITGLGLNTSGLDVSNNKILVEVIYDQNVDLRNFIYKTLNITGYEFGGWTTSQSHYSGFQGLLGTYNFIAVDKNGDLQKSYYREESLFALPHLVIDDNGKYVTSRNITLYPLLSLSTQSITLNNGKNVANESLNTHDQNNVALVVFGNDLPTITPPTKTGYTFGGYFTQQDGGGTRYYNANGTSARAADVALGTIDTLYAKWTPNIYTVSLNFDGGEVFIDNTDYVDGGEEPQTIPAVNIENINYVTATYDSAMPTPIVIPKRDGFNFGGYFTEQNGAGTKYINADGTSAHVWDIDSDTTLYAHWYQGTISFDSNGGSTCSDITAAKGVSINLPTPTRTGYTFNGWYDAETDNNGSGNPKTWTTMPDLSDTTSYPTASNNSITLYAKWTVNPAYLPNNWVELFNKEYGTSNARNLTVTSIEFASQEPTTYQDKIQIGAQSLTSNVVWSNSPLHAYVSTSGGNTTLTFYAPTTIYAPENCSKLFSAETIYRDDDGYNQAIGLSFLGVKTFKFNNFDTSNATNMSGMFFLVEEGKIFSSVNDVLQSIDVSGFDTSKVNSMKGMFAWCYTLTSLNLSSFKINSGCDVTDMLSGCNSLTSIKVPQRLSAEITLPASFKYRKGTSENTFDQLDNNIVATCGLGYVFNNSDEDYLWIDRV